MTAERKPLEANLSFPNIRQRGKEVTQAVQNKEQLIPKLLLTGQSTPVVREQLFFSASVSCFQCAICRSRSEREWYNTSLVLLCKLQTYCKHDYGNKRQNTASSHQFRFHCALLQHQFRQENPCEAGMQSDPTVTLHWVGSLEKTGSVQLHKAKSKGDGTLTVASDCGPWSGISGITVVQLQWALMLLQNCFISSSLIHQLLEQRWENLGASWCSWTRTASPSQCG